MTYRRRRKYVARRRPRRFRKGYKRIARIARRTIRSMAETKIRLKTYVGTLLNTGNSFEEDWATGMNQGSGFDERIGSQIKTKRLSLRLWLTFAPVGPNANAGAKFRLLILYPRKGVSTAKLNAYLTPTVPGVFGAVEPTLYFVIADISGALGCDLGSGTIPITENNNRPSDRLIEWCSKPKSRYVFNYDNLTVYNQPVVYICSDINSASGSISVSGYLRMSYYDI